MAARPIKYRMWDRRDSQMKPVRSIHFGANGTGLTTMVDATGLYYRGGVHGEDCILLQGTGLVDSNGVEIYEGDLFDCWSQGAHAVGVITYGVAGFYIRIPNPSAIWHLAGGKEPGIVIGNIYEHPERRP